MAGESTHTRTQLARRRLLSEAAPSLAFRHSRSLTSTPRSFRVAKDLTKLGGKTVTKLVTPSEQSTRLFKLVSLLTGWKNSLKGVGYFLGSALVSVSYELALASMVCARAACHTPRPEAICRPQWVASCSR